MPEGEAPSGRAVDLMAALEESFAQRLVGLQPGFRVADLAHLDRQLVVRKHQQDFVTREVAHLVLPQPAAAAVEDGGVAAAASWLEFPVALGIRTLPLPAFLLDLRFDGADLLPRVVELPVEPFFEGAEFGEAFIRRQVVHVFDIRR
jgi:hypothetical protein